MSHLHWSENSIFMWHYHTIKCAANKLGWALMPNHPAYTGRWQSGQRPGPNARHAVWTRSGNVGLTHLWFVRIVPLPGCIGQIGGSRRHGSGSSALWVRARALVMLGVGGSNLSANMGRRAQQEDVIVRCQAAEPRQCERWQPTRTIKTGEIPPRRLLSWSLLPCSEHMLSYSRVCILLFRNHIGAVWVLDCARRDSRPWATMLALSGSGMQDTTYKP